MVNLYVIIVGLIALVPSRSGRELFALVVKVNPGTVASDGRPIHKHTGKVEFRAQEFGSNRVTWLLQGEDVRFPPERDLTPTINASHFLNLAQVTGNANHAFVVDGCLGPSPATACLLGGKELLSGRIRLLDGEIFPLDINSPADVRLADIPRIVLGFRSLTEPVATSAHVMAAPNGLVLKRHVVLGEAKIMIGGSPFKLDLAPTKDCMLLTDNQERNCIIVLVKNLRDEHEEKEPQEDPDRHFELIYRLLRDQGVTRFVPFQRTIIGVGNEDPPSTRCVPVLLR